MDPYHDTILHDDGEKIKRLVRQRDCIHKYVKCSRCSYIPSAMPSSDSEERTMQRPRANTSTFLPLEGDDEEDVDKAPQTEDTLDRYDRERLQKGLRYVTETAKRKIPPRTQAFLELYKDAIKVALDGRAPEEPSRAVVQAMDRVYDSNAFYFEPRSEEEYQRLMFYVKLRRLELLANYGEYLAQNEMQAIATDLKDELVGSNVLELRKNVYVACGILGLDPQHMSSLIKEYIDDPTHIFLNKTRQHISDCHWNSLAEQVCRDIKELINVAPDNRVDYEKVLVGIRDEWFDVFGRDEPQHWLANGKAQGLIGEKIEGMREREAEEGRKKKEDGKIM